MKNIDLDCDATLSKRYEAIAAGIIVFDPNHQIIFANREMERILNCSWHEMKENCLYATAWTFLDVDGNKIAPDSFPSALSLATGQPFRHKVLGLKRTPADPVQWLMVDSVPVFDSAQVLAEVIVTIMDITTLRNAAEIFRENEKRMIFALESIHAGEWELHFQDFSVHYSPRSAEIFLGEECADSRISPLNEVLDCFLDKDRERVQLSVLTAMKTQEAFDVTGRIVRADGVERWVQATGRPFKIAGKVAALCGIVIDITEKKLAETSQHQNMLRSHEIVVHQAVERFGLHHCVLDCDLRYISFNQLQASLMKQLYGADITIGQCYLDYVKVDAKKALIERNLRRALAGEIFTFEHYFMLENQSLQCLVAVYCPIRNEHWQVLGVSVFAYDASNTKSAQALLRSSEYRYQKLVDDTNLFFLQLNNQGEILYLNQFGCDFFEYELTDLIGKRFEAVFAPKKPSSRCDLKKLLPRMLSRPFSGTRRRTCELITRSSKRVWAEWSYHWASNAEHANVILIAAGMDITREMQARIEEQLSCRRRKQQDFLNESIQGKLASSEFTRLARAYRILLVYPLLCLLIRPIPPVDSPSSDEPEKLAMDSLVNRLQDLTAGYVWRSSSGVCILLPLQDGGHPNQEALARKQAEKLLQQAALYGPEFSWIGGVSHAPNAATALAELYFQARAALCFGPVLQDRASFYSWRDLGSYQLLVKDLQSESTARFIEEQLGPLLTMENSDAQQELLHTLRELASFDSNEKIAQRLHVHRMTVRYRKALLEKLLDRNLSAAQALMDLSIAIQLREARKSWQ